MENILKNKKLIIITGGIIIIFLLVIITMNLGKKQKPQVVKTEDVLPKSQLIPTIDSSVEVMLTSSDKKEVVLEINKIPAGTATIEYELSYLTKEGLPKGVIGTINLEEENSTLRAEGSIKRKITLGTCSSGRCVYDQGVENIKVSLKFNGDYGSRSFEKEFNF